MVLGAFYVVVVACLPLLCLATVEVAPNVIEPQLNGTHYRITVAWGGGFLSVDTADDGSLKFSGYLIELLESVSSPDRANFTYELLLPSGQGSMCSPRLDMSNESEAALVYSHRYQAQYNCGESDVNDLPRTQYSTDMYYGMWFITRDRLLHNRFSSPFNPPITGAIVMYGTATYVRDIPDFVQQQQLGKYGPACVHSNTAYAIFLQRSFPDLELVGINATLAGHTAALRDGTCEVLFVPYPSAVMFVSAMANESSCLYEGKPVGIIGDPLNFGLSKFAIGVRKDLPLDFIQTWNYWVNVLSECAPDDNGDVCLGDSPVASYTRNIGTGYECGYVQYPPIETGLDVKMVAAIVASSVVIVIIICSSIYSYKLKKQHQRIKKRFVQQIARNITIGPCPGDIPVDKLAEEVQHIGDGEGNISKQDLLNWLNDVKLTFLSDKDFNALWAAIDVDGKGKVDAIEFFVFLSKCGPQFKEVHEEESNMTKLERLKLAARRLSNIKHLGEDGVRKLENGLERTARKNVYISNRRGALEEPIAFDPLDISENSLAKKISQRASSAMESLLEFSEKSRSRSKLVT